MRRYRLLEKPKSDLSIFGVLECIMCDEEDLTIGDDEKRAGVLLRWLNERGCSYHIEITLETSTSTFPTYHFIDYRSILLYDVLIYDDETATLMSFFHEDFKEIVSPEELAKREVAIEELAIEELAIEELAIENPTVHPVVSEKPEAISVIEDDPAPPTRRILQRFGKMIFGS